MFCQAGRYQQLFHLNEKGDIVSRDVPRILGIIKCDPEQKGKMEGKIEYAKVMLSKGMDISLISEITDLSKERILQLKSEL